MFEGIRSCSFPGTHNVLLSKEMIIIGFLRQKKRDTGFLSGLEPKRMSSDGTLGIRMKLGWELE